MMTGSAQMTVRCLFYCRPKGERYPPHRQRGGLTKFNEKK